MREPLQRSERSGRADPRRQLPLWTPTALALMVIGDLSAIVALRPPAGIANAVLVAGTTAAIGSALAVWCRSRSRSRARPMGLSWTRLCAAGALLAVVGVAGCVAVVGLVALFRVIGLLVLFSLAVTSPAVRNRLGDQVGRSATADQEAVEGAESLSISPAVQSDGQRALSELTNAELCRRWRTAYLRLHDPAFATHFTAVVNTRRALLDELTDRDPAGISRWLASGARAAGDPYPFLDPADRCTASDAEHRHDRDTFS
jgi:hypothetical protein